MKMNRTRGFTLLELLVVIAVIAVLLSLILVSLQSSRNKGKDSRTKEELNDVRNTALSESIPNKDFVTVFSSGPAKDSVDEFISRGGLTAGQYEIAVTANEFSLIFPLKSETGYWCTDSSGLSKKVDGFVNTTGSKSCNNTQAAGSPPVANIYFFSDPTNVTIPWGDGGASMWIMLTGELSGNQSGHQYQWSQLSGPAGGWKFGDTTNSTARFYAVDPNATGSYVIQLRVTNAYGSSTDTVTFIAN
jgi:prepilin-type N-terminal cleavage/methylation domain-containing protein